MSNKYLAWMLRITQNGSGKDQVWRASLEDPHSRERVGFETLEALYDFIQQSLSSPDPGQEFHVDNGSK